MVSTHAIYRVANSAFSVNDLLNGLLRIITNSFKSNKVTIILSQNGKKNFLKYTLQKHKKVNITRGRKNILNKTEEFVLKTSKTIFHLHFIAVPLLFINNLGLLSIRRSSKDIPFESYDKEMLVALTEEIAIVLRNYQLYEDQQKTVIGAVKAMTKFLDKRAPTSHINMEFFSSVIQKLAKKTNLNNSQILSLKYAAMLHDAGKLDIPLDILLKKNAPLTKEEIEIIKKHPVKGAKLIKDLKTLRPIIPIILHHHEKYDGTGYPSNLKKNQIPIEARIMSIIDAFDAMIFGRPYKDRMNLKEAIEEIKKHKSTQFDPKIVDYFVEIVGQKSMQRKLHRLIKKS